MPRPIGMCEGQPCWSAQEIADIAVELADANAILADANAALALADVQQQAAQSAVMTLEQEQSQANANPCP